MVYSDFSASYLLQRALPHCATNFAARPLQEAASPSKPHAPADSGGFFAYTGERLPW
jgi:hypothetical protein